VSGRKLAVAGAILAVGVLVSAVLVWLRPRAELEAPSVVAPLVRIQSVSRAPIEFVVRGHGTVVPRTETDLVAQVAGEVVWVAPEFVAGGFFAEGDVLLRIEPVDYEAALESARAGLARAKSERARASKELERQRRLVDRSIASESRIDDAENAFAVAEAGLREARARLTRAELDLERTEIQAPYDGRVRVENVDIGRFVTRGVTVGTVYAVDYAEVRLPVPDRELSYLDLPLGFQAGEQGEGPAVRLAAEFAGRAHTWEGRVVRTEGEIDPRSRTVNVVARVEDPYGRSAREAGVPLAVGLFVEAEIRGRAVPDAVVLPRAALREGDRVLVLDEESRLRFRAVDVLRVQGDQVVIGDGLREGERVCVSPLAAPVDGMSVRVLDDAPELARVGS
jgi:RND family efflux transporter MFP subunit